MRRGERLRALASRLFDVGTMERVVDPAIADLQAEPPSLARYFAVLKVIVLCAPQVSMKLGFAFVLTAAALAFVVGVFELRPLVFVWNQDGFDVRMLGYLLPQSAAIAVIIALTVGVLAACGGRAISRTAVVRVAALALAVSALSFINAGWITPAANQAFRAAFTERTQPGGSPPQRGFPELTFPEVRRQYAYYTFSRHVDPLDLHYVAVNYHGRWALTFAPLLFAAFALAVAGLKPVARWTAGLGVCAFYVTYLFYMDVPNLPALDGRWLGGAAWYPELALAALTCVLMFMHRREAHGAAG
jgi:hypothetical protein